MHLERIEIQGFKSFAHKVTLEFPRPAQSRDFGNGNHGIACIVGPNGAGKSNVVDAIRWVLGEQSLKSLRGKKSHDVIFSGSENKGRLGMASVSLHINNEDGSMPVDYKEVVISRKLYRNGESEYLINKNTVRLQDVLLLVAQSNFGQKSYSIVSQGSIDQIIMASPADRKEYFDEAVGVKQFQIKRDQSINKLESAWNNLRQVDALLTEIKPRVNSLTRQVRRLERREKVETELRELQRSYYGFLWQELQRAINVIRPSLKDKEREVAEHHRTLQTLQQQLQTLEKEESRTSAFSGLQQNLQSVVDQKGKLREEQLMLINKIELAKQRLVTKASILPLPDIVSKLKEIGKLQDAIVKNLANGSGASLAQARADAAELAGLLKDLLHQLEHPAAARQGSDDLPVDPALTKDLKEVEEELRGFEERVTEARKKIEQFNQGEEQKKGTFFTLQRQITEQQNRYNQLASDVSSLRVEMAKLETRLADLEQEIKQELTSTGWLKDYEVKTVKTDTLHTEIQRLKHELELIGGVDPEVVTEYQQTKERFDFLAGQADDLRDAIKSLEKIIDDLDEKIHLQFDVAFKHINKEFDKFFKILFGGGKAELTLIKQEAIEPAVDTPTMEGEPTEEPAGIVARLTAEEEKLSPKRFLKKRGGKVIAGIDITATPPGKKVSSITMLSGGERSLASIALICSVIANNPSPFVILDEVDAALDEANSNRFAKILDELAHKTQFVVITHNRSTMQHATILYGVTMGDDGASRLLSLKLEEAVKVVRQ